MRPPAQEVLERLPFAVALVAPNGDLAWANPRFGALCGARLPELLSGPPCEGVRALRLAGRDGEAVEVLAHCLESGEYRLIALDETPGGNDRVIQGLRERIAALERAATLDELTGAWNRRWIDQALPAELARSRRYRHPLSAMLADIDHFKAINDRLGHLAGDAVLRELVAVARATMRDADALARWGGEEFLFLLPNTGHGAAAVAAEKLRRAVEAHAFPGAGRVTVSIGVTEALEEDDPKGCSAGSTKPFTGPRTAAATALSPMRAVPPTPGHGTASSCSSSGRRASAAASRPSTRSTKSSSAWPTS